MPGADPVRVDLPDGSEVIPRPVEPAVGDAPTLGLALRTAATGHVRTAPRH